MSYQDVKNTRERNKKRLVAGFGGLQCPICGFVGPEVVFDFHHLDATQKDFPVCQVLNRSFETLCNEAEKCTLICANCHRMVTNNFINLNNYQLPKFNKEIAEKCLKNNCNVCGIEISLSMTICKECKSKKIKDGMEKAKKEKENFISREELKNKIRKIPFTKIAQEFRVSDNAIRRWCDRHSLPRTKKEIDSYSDEEWLNI
ncbi:MAG: hypothetical protein M0R38_11345 [Bacteroidia bacterium]|nr:hypothetical protein [Bacteroidia bacterium]